jgi:hypothetical protein
MFALNRMVAIALCLAYFGVAAQASAGEDPMTCVKEVAAPQFLGNMQGLPARVEVTVELGTGGALASVKSKTDVDWIKTEMALAFGSRAQYLDACRGKTLQFVVSYVLDGKPTDKPISETTIRMPNEFIIRYRPMLAAAK